MLLARANGSELTGRLYSKMAHVNIVNYTDNIWGKLRNYVLSC